MKHLVYTAMFALVAAMDICPADDEITLSFEEICDTPAAMEGWTYKVVKTPDGASMCKILVSVRAVEGKVLDSSKFSVQAEWQEKYTPQRGERGVDASELSFQVNVQMDASRLRWLKENPDWADGVECFEISFPVAIPADRMSCSSGKLSVTLYYDGQDTSWFHGYGPQMWFCD